MTVFSTTNATALQILSAVSQGSSWRTEQATWVRPPNLGPGNGSPGGGMGISTPLDPRSNAAKDAAAKITAILSEAEKNSDLPARTSTPGDASPGTPQYGIYVGGDGNDNILAVYSAYAKVDSGAGDDRIRASKYSEVAAGDGNDWVYTGAYSTIDGGAGDDYLYGTRYMTIYGGEGNDEIRAVDYATIDAGEGDDLVITYGGSTIHGGAGNDIIIATEQGKTWVTEAQGPGYHRTYGYNDIDGGEGDDYIQTTDNSTVRGGAGNDTIRLIGGGSTVMYAKGDGQDAILADEDFVLNIAGYSKDEVTITAQGEDFVVSFAGSDERISLMLSKGATANLVFEDGSSLEVVGDARDRRLASLRAGVDWDNVTVISGNGRHSARDISDRQKALRSQSEQLRESVGFRVQEIQTNLEMQEIRGVQAVWVARWER